MHAKARTPFVVVLFCLLLATLATGCGSKVVKPDSPAQALAYVEAQFGATVATAADLRDAGLMTTEQGQKADDLIQSGYEYLQAARAAQDAGNTQTVSGYTLKVLSLLQSVQTIMAEARTDEGN